MHQNALMGSSGSGECTIGRLTLRGEVVESPGEEGGEETVPAPSLTLETSNDVFLTHHSVHLVEMKAT